MKATALYQYIPSPSDGSHLQINPGDSLVISRIEESGWCLGSKNEGIREESGWFPVSYVEILEDEEEDCGIPSPPNLPVPLPLEEQEQEPALSVKEKVINVKLGVPLTPITPVSIANTEEFDQVSLHNYAQSIKSLKSLTFSPQQDSKQISPIQNSDGKFSFDLNFWGDKADKSGFDILVLKHRNGKEVCKDLASLLETRAKIEETYAKSLQDLSSSQLCSQESASSATALNQLKFDLQSQSKSRLAFSKQLYKLHKQVMDFKNEQKKSRKNYEIIIKELRKNLILRFKDVQKSYRNYLSKCKECEFSKDKKSRKNATLAIYEYKQALVDYSQVRMEFISSMKDCMAEFEVSEEERIGFLKTILKEYLGSEFVVNRECVSSGELVESSVEGVDAFVDLEIFVKGNCTGGFMPVELEFEQYKDFC